MDKVQILWMDKTNEVNKYEIYHSLRFSYEKVC